MPNRVLTAGRRLGAALILGLCILWFWAASAEAAAPQGELVLVLKPSAVRADADRLAQGLQARVVASIPQLDAYLIDLPGTDRPNRPLLEELLRKLKVRAAEATMDFAPAEVAPLAVSFNDPLIPSAWHLSKIKAGDAWSTSTGLSSTVIAVVDTGVDYNHPDLSGKVTLGYDYGAGDSDPKDTQGHGTHVAGIAAAKAGNGIGSAGVCPSCQLMAVKVFPDGSSSASSFAIAQGITWAVDHGADVVNLSLGGSSSSFVMQSAVDYAWSKGVVVVAAAGNSATSTKHYPAAYPNAMAVGSTTSADALSSFSNFGDWVDLTAPGSSILSTIMGGSYQSWSGTSMATPVVAGAAGLVFSGLPGATNVTVRAALEQAVADLGSPGKDTTFGFGRIDLSRLFSASAPPQPPPATPPSITTASLPGGQVGTAYNGALAATGGTLPYAWSVVSGALPAGVSLNAATGVLSGTPTAAGTASFTIQVADAGGLTGTRAFSIVIAAAPPPPSQPDLSGVWTKAKQGQSKIKGDYTLTLTGGTVASVTVRFQLLGASGSVLAAKDVVLTSLAPGQFFLRVEWPGTSWGSSLRVRAIIDPAGLVAEANEQNNTAEAAVTTG